MLAMGFEPTSSLLKRQVRQPLRYASACKNHSASAPHGCRTRLITIKSRVHDRSANGAKFYDSAFVSVFVSSSLSSLLSLYNCSNRNRTSGFLRNLFGFSSKTLSHPLRGFVYRTPSGFGTITFRVWTEYSRQLSYAAAPGTGFEPATS